MPDWLVDPSLTTPAQAEPPTDRRNRRERRKAADANRRLELKRDRAVRLASARRETNPIAYIVGAILLLGVLVGAVTVLPWLTGHRPNALPPVPATQASAAPAASSTTGASPPAAAPTSSTPPGRRLQGAPLATAWLTGFLTRDGRTDERWAGVIADITTPQLLNELKAQGADVVGLTQLSTWRVSRIRPIPDGADAVSTLTRQVLAYSATVTDGTHTASKPFELYAYRATVTAPWIVSAVNQPYSSEG